MPRRGSASDIGDRRSHIPLTVETFLPRKRWRHARLRQKYRPAPNNKECGRTCVFYAVEICTLVVICTVFLEEGSPEDIRDGVRSANEKPGRVGSRPRRLLSVSRALMENHVHTARS